MADREALADFGRGRLAEIDELLERLEREYREADDDDDLLTWSILDVRIARLRAERDRYLAQLEALGVYPSGQEVPHGPLA